MRYPGFVGGTFQGLNRTLEAEHTVNWYVADSGSKGATASKSLYPTPGVMNLSDHTGGVGRGHYCLNDREFAVIGSDLVEISASGAQTSRGTVAVDQNPATIIGNGDEGNQLYITSGNRGYSYNLGTNVLAAVATMSGVATMGDMLDGYGLNLNSATSTLYVSDLTDLATWSASQIARRSLAPDPWVSVKVLGRFVWLLGQYTSEIWYNVGSSSSFPFAPYAVGLVPNGCAAPFSPAVAGGTTLCWLGQSEDGGPSVLAVTGSVPEKISTGEMDEVLSSYSTVDDAIGGSFTWQGHVFYYLTFVAEDITWAYDLTSRTWIQLGTWIEENGSFSAWRPRFHALAFGQARMLDGDGGGVYALSADSFEDVDERIIRRVRRAPCLSLENKLVTYASLELDIEPGLGTSGQAEDPQVMLRWSNDGGKTWGPETWRGAGKRGEYGKRVRWERLGQARRRVFEVSVTDPWPPRIADAYVELAGDNVVKARSR